MKCELSKNCKLYSKHAYVCNTNTNHSYCGYYRIQNQKQPNDKYEEAMDSQYDGKVKLTEHGN